MTTSTNTVRTTVPTDRQQPLLPPLIKEPATFKMTIPRCVEEKIRYLLHKFPSTEWSGILFYN